MSLTDKQNNNIKLILLTGFLGAGKTTLLKQLLQAYEHTKIGVLMNEFGETSIDGQLIHQGDFDMIELTNGSIFCACLKENFIYGLAEFLNRDLEIVFVESSGVADPANMGTILEMVKKVSGKNYDYAGSICIVDGVYFLKQLDLIPALKKQIAYATEVIINKADLQSKNELRIIEKTIQNINTIAGIQTTSFCKVPILEMVYSMRGNNTEALPSENTWESRPKTSVLTTEEEVNFEHFKQFLQEIKSSTYRIKGFIRTTQGVFEVSSVNDLAVMNPWHNHLEKTKVVFISSVGIKMTSDLLSSWKTHMGNVSINI